MAIILLALLEAGFMALDGTRALRVGSFITPTTGPYAGQVGPWRHVARAVGIDPTGAPMKWIFALYGWTWLGLAAAFMLGKSWAWGAMVGAAAGALWFLPFGTLLSIVQLALLVLWRSRLNGSGGTAHAG